jgi:hypothetical protein
MRRRCGRLRLARLVSDFFHVSLWADLKIDHHVSLSQNPAFHQTVV